MKRVVPILLACAAALFAGLWWRAESDLGARSSEVANLQAELAKSKTLPAAAPVEEPPAQPGAVPQKETRIVRIPSGTDPTEYLKVIDELRQQVLRLQKDVSAAQDDAARAEAQRAALAVETAKSQAQLAEVRDDLQSARRAVAAYEAELRTKSDRLVRAETAEKLAAGKLTRAEASASKIQEASRELEELNRRREALQTTLARRYREVTDLYRNFTLNAQSRENAAPGLQAGDLSRIQTSIQQAEDDLRQLSVLNARASQLARVR